MRTTKAWSVSMAASLSLLALFLNLFGSSARADLVTHLPLDGDLFDEGPAGNDGTFMEGTVATGLETFEDGFDGTPGGALTLDGVDDFVMLTPNDGLPLVQHAAFSIAMWVKGPPLQDDKRVWSESSSTDGNPLWNIGTHNDATDGTVDSYIRPVTGREHIHSAGTAFDDLWHHIAWVDDGGVVTLYIDGIADTTSFNYTRPDSGLFDLTTLGGIYRPSHTLVLCCFFTGAIDDVHLFDHALTELEVKAIMVPSGGCPTEGDTTCDDIAVNGPTGEPGLYTLSAENAVDTSGDAILYTFLADDGAGNVLRAGPQTETTAQFTLTAGTWIVSVTVDDDLACDDVAVGATRSRTLSLVCPAAGDTTVTGLTASGPAGNLPGNYTIQATGAADATGNQILYTYTADNGVDAPWVYGPYTDIDEILLGLRPGTWTLSVTVDDNPSCDDPVGTASTSITVNAPAPALVSRWALDGALADSQPAGNDGAFQGDVAPTFVEGYDLEDPGAVRFDGIDDLVFMEQDLGLPIHANKAYTVALWVKGIGTGQSDRRVFSEANGLAGGGGAPAHPQNINPLFNIGTHNAGTDGTVDIFIRGDTGANPINHRHTARTAFDGEWHHIAWVDDDGNARVYIDAVRDQTNFRYDRPLLTADTTTIGGILRGGPSSWFAGDVDDVRVYNYALTEAEIVALVPEASGCPGDSDTTVSDISVTPPTWGTFPGDYTLTAVGASDGSGDSILYTFVAERASDGAYLQVGPDVNDFAEMRLTAGNWKLTLKVDDDLRCRDDSPNAVRTKDITVADLPRELISHWKFDADLLDSGAAGNGGETVGGLAPVFGEDHEGNAESAICLDGVNESVVRVNISDGLPVHSNPKFSAFTFAAWVKGLPQPDRRIYAEGSAADGDLLFTLGTQNGGTTGQFDLFVRTDDGTTVTTTVNHRHSQGIVFDDTWHHVAFVDRSGQAALYIDGVLDGTDFSYAKPTYGKPALLLDTAAIGGVFRAAASYPFLGCIDDVRIYNYALSQEEVQDIMEGGTTELPKFRRGDSNADGGINITDGIFTLNFLFLGGPAPTCRESADANNDGAINITDGIFVLNYLFLGGPLPPEPGPKMCGPDTDPPGSPKDLGCLEYTKC